MTDDEIILEVFRFNPDVDKEPYFKTYVVKVNLEETDVLNLLQYVRENIDSSLAFNDHATCQGQGICKNCVMKINGKPRLACQTNIEEKRIKIEPVKKDRVIRDLVTN